MEKGNEEWKTRTWSRLVILKFLSWSRLEHRGSTLASLEILHFWDSKSLSPFSARPPPSAFLSAFFPSRLPQEWSISPAYSPGGFVQPQFPNCSTFLPYKSTKALTAVWSGWSKQWSHSWYISFYMFLSPHCWDKISNQKFTGARTCVGSQLDTRHHCRDSRETATGSKYSNCTQVWGAEIGESQNSANLLLLRVWDPSWRCCAIHI